VGIGQLCFQHAIKIDHKIIVILLATFLMAKGGRGSNGCGNGSGGRGRGGRKQPQDGTAPLRCTAETGACAALGSSILIISSGNKARDGNTLRTTKEAMVLYIGTTMGEDTSKEFAMGQLTVLTIPPQDAAITARHAARVQAHWTRLTEKVANLEVQKTAIKAALALDPTNRPILREKMEVDDHLSKIRFELTEELEIVLTLDEKAERSNVYCTYHQDEQRLISKRGKVYTLTLGQCTQTLKDKLKKDRHWESIPLAYNPIGLLQLIEKYVLKQTESHYPYLVVQEEMQSMLNFSQGEDMSLGMFYEKFTTRVAIADRAGCIFTTPALLDVEADVMFSSDDGGTTSYESLTLDQKATVNKTCRDKYLATLYLMRSGKRHTQLKNDIKNDHAKGVENSFPTTFASAMQIMNDFKPVMTEASVPLSLGTAFVQRGVKRPLKVQLSDEAWNVLTPEA
jgi:hypothetical protein